jgi:hypothetical protein
MYIGTPAIPLLFRILSLLRSGPVGASFFREVQLMPANVGAPALLGGADVTRLFDQVMECCSSLSNFANFVFTHKDIKAVKGNVSHLSFRRLLCREANQFYSE